MAKLIKKAANTKNSRVITLKYGRDNGRTQLDVKSKVMNPEKPWFKFVDWSK